MIAQVRLQLQQTEHGGNNPEQLEQLMLQLMGLEKMKAYISQALGFRTIV